MNIFYLDSNPQKCAEYHCDKHVVKMILESAQLLCGVHHMTEQVTEQVVKDSLTTQTVEYGQENP